jgi:hypothetical protein
MESPIIGKIFGETNDPTSMNAGVSSETISRNVSILASDVHFDGSAFWIPSRSDTSNNCGLILANIPVRIGQP